jgi:maltose alpha-D-glucosyltransferase/alpha-amylase
LLDDPLWYKDAILYEVHVRAFYDSDGDGVGDFRGLTAKLDYLQDLGVTAIWVLPFYPSPLRDDGYDIADYYNVHEDYGALRDVKQLVREAHRRGLRVITELVCNHTSDQHPWFQRARRARPGSSARNFYVWSDTPERYREARIIFKDFETSNWSWDPVASAHYWHRFYSHQPDLNYDNPQVQRAIFKVMDFWLQMGIDGLRLDAVPYLYEREGTNCENLPPTHTFLRALRRHIDARFANRVLLAEANQWPEDSVAYFGAGDECHMAFHFPLMPRMFMAIRMEDRFPILDILAQTPTIPDNAQWALFLRNHDELTLEMVTDEERDYMYRVYAEDPQMRINLGIRRRLAPLLGNHRRRIELMNGLLFSLPGTPVIYYGDEIGMGDNIYLGDRDGVRTPMQWSADRNAGFSTANRQRLYQPVIVDLEYHYEAVNVEVQQNNPHSLLWWMKRLIALRKHYRAFSRGTLEFLHPENRKVLVFVRRYEDERVLVVANLSRFVQCVEIDLSAFRGLVPVEMFGRTEFPPVRDQPYFLTLGPHAFYWFSLEPQRAAVVATPAVDVPTLAVQTSWEEALVGQGQTALAAMLPAYLRSRRWYGGKARRITGAQVLDSVPTPLDGTTAYLTLVRIAFTEGDPDTYLLPLACATERRGERLRELGSAVVAQLVDRDRQPLGVLYDALADRDFCIALLDLVSGRRRLRGTGGELRASTTGAARRVLGPAPAALTPAPLRGEQSNSSIVYGDRAILKLFRRVEAGLNPDLEVGRFLTERGFPHSPPVAGWLEHQRGRGRPMTIALLHGLVPDATDAWKCTADSLSEYFERALASRGNSPEPPPPLPLLDLAELEAPPAAWETIGAYLESARLLGQRTAELHCALASDPTDPAFAPEPFSALYQRSIYQSMRAQTIQAFQMLRRALPRLEGPARDEADRVAALESEILGRLRALVDTRINASRIRCHGDYHLGQVMYTGRDFAIIDFEGEPARPLGERRLKRSPLRDVAGMLRSFHYASRAALFNAEATALVRPADVATLEPWAQYWHLWVSAVFLRAYLEEAGTPSFVPRERAELAVLLDTHLLEKAVYELVYELNNRPNWITIPLQGIASLVRP